MTRETVRSSVYSLDTWLFLHRQNNQSIDRSIGVGGVVGGGGVVGERDEERDETRRHE